MRTLVLLALVAALSACGQANSYPPHYRDAFMTSCQNNGSPASHCACVWDHIETEIPRAEFEAADRAMRTGQPHPITQQVLGFSEQCRAAP